MKSLINVRLAVPQDVLAIINFNKAMAWETEKKELNDELLFSGVKRVLDSKAEAFYLVATTSEQIIASLMVTKEWSDWRNAFIWWIQSVYVLPQYRRLGVYSKLYSKVKELGRQSDCCGFRLYVEKNNSSAQTTYSNAGMCQSHYLIYEEMLNEK